MPPLILLTILVFIVIILKGNMDMFQLLQSIFYVAIIIATTSKLATQKPVKLLPEVSQCVCAIPVGDKVKIVDSEIVNSATKEENFQDQTLSSQMVNETKVYPLQTPVKFSDQSWTNTYEGYYTINEDHRYENDADTRLSRLQENMTQKAKESILHRNNMTRDTFQKYFTKELAGMENRKWWEREGEDDFAGLDNYDHPEFLTY